MPRKAVKKKQEEVPNLDLANIAKPIPLADIIDLRNKGLTLEQIGKLVGCSHQNISYRLQPFMEEIEGLKSFKDNRADVLAAYQHRILNSLQATDLGKSSPYQKVGMFGILYDKERLERGQSTSNVAYADYSRTVSDMDKEIASLESEVGILSENDES